MRIRRKKKQPNSQSINQANQRSQPPIQNQSEAADLPTLQQQAEQPGKNFGDISIFSPEQSANPVPLQAKLTIGQPNDKYEQEADSVAADVVQTINSPEANQPIQKTEEEEVQTKSLHLQADGMTAAASAAPPEVEQGINSAKGGGQPLAPNLQQKMGNAMGTDFSGVRIHTDNRADQLNESIQAKAFTTGRDVFFKQGAYQPNSRGGQELIAHELTHVVQQNGDGIKRKSDGVIRRYIVKKNGKAGKSIATLKEALNFLVKDHNMDRTLAMAIVIQAKRSKQEVSFADMLRDARIATRDAAITNEEDEKSQNAASAIPTNTDEATDATDEIIQQPQQHTGQLTDVADDKEADDEKVFESSSDASLILELAEYMMDQSSDWWTEQFAHFNKMMFQNNIAVLNMWNTSFKLGFKPEEVLEKSSEIVNGYAQEAAKLNQTTTICDLVAKFIMMSIVGGGNYEEVQAEYEQNFGLESSQSSSEDEDFIESDTWTKGYAVGQHEVFESHMQQWLDQDAYGVMQVKFNGDHGPHTFVLERRGNGEFHMVQAYQGGLHLHEFMENAVLVSKTNPQKRQPNEFGQGKSLTKNKIKSLMSCLSTALSTGKKSEGIPATTYLQAFGAYYDDQATKVTNIALLAFNVTESQDDVNYKSQKGFVETM